VPDIRLICQVTRSHTTIEGAGVRLSRAIGFGDPQVHDPFLLLDDFRSDDPSDYLKGFPWHPHRGIETITYVLRGDIEHLDSLGNGGVISSGDVQWMTAGSGIIHEEMPKGDPHKAMHGFQLWANLPAADKMMGPRYRGLTSADIPEVGQSNGVRVKVIAGNVGGVVGPVRDVVTAPEYLDVWVPPGETFFHPVPREHTAFAYVIGGSGDFGGQEPPHDLEAKQVRHPATDRGTGIGDGHLVLFGDGDALLIGAKQDPLRFLLFSGRPIREPVAWRGPIVMNTQEELRIAFAELEEGTFLRSGTSTR
jgi:redox-sensitive bicupin YhaK (pirin superfamily)